MKSDFVLCLCMMPRPQSAAQVGMNQVYPGCECDTDGVMTVGWTGTGLNYVIIGDASHCCCYGLTEEWVSLTSSSL